MADSALVVQAMSARALRRIACTPDDFGVFFGPEDETVAGRNRREAEAVRICAGCPSRLPCLEWALAHAIPYGVFGGVGEKDRQRLRNPDSLPMCRNDLHVLTPDNIYTYPNGVKACRACREASERQRPPRSHDRQQREERAA